MAGVGTFLRVLSGLCLVVVAVTFTSAAQYRPVVVMHGIANNSECMWLVEKWVRDAMPGVYVVSVEVGNGKEDSLFMLLNKQVICGLGVSGSGLVQQILRQVELFAQKVQADEHVANGFNLVGYSQGGIIARGYIERFNQPPVHNFITWSSPHAGIYGVPQVPFSHIEWIDNLVSRLAYVDWVQEWIGFAGYWNDPNIHETYLQKSLFMADLNNEREEKNATYVERITSLNYWRMLWSTIDDTVVPRQSSIFSFYDYDQPDIIVPMRERAFYQEDWLGVRVLDESGRLDLVTVTIPHPEYPDARGQAIFEAWTLPLLNETVSMDGV